MHRRRVLAIIASLLLAPAFPSGAPISKPDRDKVVHYLSRRAIRSSPKRRSCPTHSGISKPVPIGGR